MKTLEKKKSPLWHFPWGYRESFIVSFGILIIGFLVEFFTKNIGISPPSWPRNLYILIIFVAYLVVTYRFIKHPILKWITSVPAAISAVSIFTLLVLFMGFIAQNDQEANSFIRNFGLAHIARSWPYLTTTLYLLTVLGYSTIKRLSHFRKLKDFAFILNHAGLWLVIVTASLGSGDMYRLSMPVYEGQVSHQAFDDQGNPFQIGFATKLLDFNMEEYPPSLGIMDNMTRELIIEKGGKLFNVDEGNGEINGWKISVLKYFESSVKNNEEYVSSDTFGAARAVLVEAVNTSTKETSVGWISNGSFSVPLAILKLNDEVSLAMTRPQPKKYSSKLRIFSSMRDYKDYTVIVNKPLKINGWKVYQQGYNDELGKWSNLSVLELVRDPWLPVVYVGIFMMLAGALYLFWMGRGK